MLVIAWEDCNLSGDDLLIPANIAWADEPVLFVLPHAVADRKLRRSGVPLLQSMSKHRGRIAYAADKACRPERMRRIGGVDRISLTAGDFECRFE